ncbi:MAG: penicillin-binding protein 2 [Patescibacteria group bacterium]|nr:penicillin-binding protein 2 [Patescibacteria group bacterium]
MKEVNPFIPQLDKNFKEYSVGKLKEHEIEGDFTSASRAKFLKLSFNSKNITWIFIVFFLGIIVLASRLFFLQIVKNDYYLNLAEGNRIRLHTILSPRGIFYDRNNQPLVKNVPRFFLQIVPADLPLDITERNNLIQQVSNQTHIIQSKIEDRLATVSKYSYQPIVFDQTLDYQTALLFKTQENNLPGFNIVTQESREYLYPQALAHVLGYIGIISSEEIQKLEKENYTSQDLIGKTGLEYFYEPFLKGQNGVEKVEVNSIGKVARVIDSRAPQSGQDIYLTLDLDLQLRLTEITQGILDKNNLVRGAVIAMDPRDGSVLALNSFPTFDNNKFVTGFSQSEFEQVFNNPDQPLFKRFIQGEYPPGSVIKPLIALGALEEGIINRNTSFLSVGGFWISEWFFPDWKAGGHGLTNVTKAIAESVNTFFYYIGGGYQDFQGLGLEKINYYLKKFGLTQVTGIDLANEKSGFLPTQEWKEEVKNEVWYIGDTYHLSIGQGDVLVTPLQVANYTAAIANDGTLYQPHLIQQHQPIILSQNLVDFKNLEIVQQGLHETTLYGSASSFSAWGISAAGKTGTAQVGGDKLPHSWFTGYAPYDDPEIVITVLIENAGDGSLYASPIAREFLKYYFDRQPVVDKPLD